LFGKPEEGGGRERDREKKAPKNKGEEEKKGNFSLTLQ
jgi:hypothetical protein